MEHPGSGIISEGHVCLQVKLKRSCVDLSCIHAEKKIDPSPNDAPFRDKSLIHRHLQAQDSNLVLLKQIVWRIDLILRFKGQNFFHMN